MSVQNAIVTALMTSVERLQGAIIAEEPEFISLQAEAVVHFADLLSQNQAALVACIDALESAFVVEIGPVEGDLRAWLEQIVAQGFTPEQYNNLIEAGLTDEEIQWLIDQFNAVPPTSDTQALLDWAAFIEESMIPDLADMSGQMSVIVETLEEVINPPASNNPPSFDEPPTPPAGTEFIVAVGDTLAFDVQASDPDTGDEVNLGIVDTPSGATMLVSKVGATSTGSFSWTSTADQTGVHIITFTAIDNHGASGAPHQIVVIVELINVPPVADVNGPYWVDEGGSVNLNGTGSTDPDGDPLTYEWDLDNDGTFETPGATPVFSAGGRDGPDTQPIALRVCDPLGECDTAVSVVNINNVAPTASANPTDQTVQYSDYIAVFTIEAMDIAADTLTATTSWSFDGGGFTTGLPNFLALTDNGCSAGAQALLPSQQAITRFVSV